MYQIGDLIVYGGEGVCRVEAIGPLERQCAIQNVDYYTLAPLYRSGTIYTPVTTAVFSRPVMSRGDAEQLIAGIPEITEQVYESSNPRLLTEHYQTYLKSHDCTQLVRLIRSIYAKGKRAAQCGKRLGQVDERSMKQAVEMLHGELAVALGIQKEEVELYIARKLESNE